MADDVVIRAEGLGKRYMIGHAAERERYVALRDVLVRGAHNLWRKTGDMARGRAIVAGDTVEEFWALKDISFEVKRGEVLGIIGRNGAGKSTLLKILSRITEPSEGRVTIKGRVASLLEVGTGFHPELTGRENIYLNGAILGMTRAEIRRKFDEIVAFAEVEKFLDTPVKRYSSGMYVRLAFAVAAHLEPEILVVDEVLAVGDAEFQKKCLGKMSEVADGGRTVLFVSHNMGSIQRLCTKAMILSFGGLISISESISASISRYTSINLGSLDSAWVNGGSDYENDFFVPLSLKVNSVSNVDQLTTFSDSKFDVEIIGHILRRDPALSIAFCVYLADGQRLFWSSPHDCNGDDHQTFPVGRVIFRAGLPSNLLNEGEHEIELIAFLHNRQIIIAPGSGPRIRFMNSMSFLSPIWDRRRDGVIAPKIPWEIELGSDSHADSSAKSCYSAS
jgi:lipopolysaccharide transport system ATP-binding protein